MSENPLQPGARIGNYLLQERIGEGAFAQVWKAVHHERPNRVVAVKIAVDEAFRRQLSREGRLPDIDHPNVVPILDSDTRFSTPPYIVMPYLSGGSLANLIAKHPQGLPEDRVEALLQDILAGLAAAHERGIVHRDIKPENVLLDGNGRALISDFGLSVLGSGPESTRSIVQSVSLSLEQNRTLAGTLSYMAPEVLESGSTSAKADVYAVGVTFFELLVGRRPAGAQVPSIRRRDLRHAEHWDSLYRRACDYVDNRFPDGRAMAEAINRQMEVKKTQLGPAAVVALTTAPSSVVSSTALSQMLTVDLGSGCTMDMMLIPASEFLRGSPNEDEHRSIGEEPRLRVRVSRPFYVGRVPVSEAQWHAIRRTAPLSFIGLRCLKWLEPHPRLPMVNITWRDCLAFCRILTLKIGKTVRLLSEAEWEYACRAGSAARYCFGDSEDKLEEYAWYACNSGGVRHLTGQKSANAWGLHDMHGNVWEWCTTGSGTQVLRGGSCRNSAAECRCAVRRIPEPNEFFSNCGFRVAMGAE